MKPSIIARLLMAAALLTATMPATAQKVLKKDFVNTERYAKANAQLPPPAAKERRVVFMGNSIIQAWQEIYPEFFKRTGYIGRGISGQTSYQFLLRLRNDVIDLKPRLVVLGSCVNDIAENTCPYNEEQTMRNIMTMVDICRANKIKVILASVMPSKTIPWRQIDNVPAKIRSLNKRIEAYARQQAIPFADYYTPMLADDGESQRPELSRDGLHPNKDGYMVLERVILPLIKKTL